MPPESSLALKPLLYDDDDGTRKPVKPGPVDRFKRRGMAKTKGSKDKRPKAGEKARAAYEKFRDKKTKGGAKAAFPRTPLQKRMQSGDL